MQLPGDVRFNYFDSEGNMQELTVEELTKGKKVSDRTSTSHSDIISRKEVLKMNENDVIGVQ